MRSQQLTRRTARIPTSTRRWPSVMIVLVTLVLFAGPVAGQDDPLAAVAEQAAVLDAAPVLSSGSLKFDAATLAAGAFIWIEVPEDGFYTLSLSRPGALVLGSFPNAEGRYDGQTQPARHGTALSQDQRPALGPLLLSRVHPYLLSASSSVGAGTVTLERIATVPPLQASPENGTVIPDGEWLLAPESRLNLTLAGRPGERRRIEVIAEARASLDARLAGEAVPPGGRYPLVSESDLPLTMTTSAGKDSPPARVLIRLGAAPGALDESEPDENRPNPLAVAQTFHGVLLSRDTDLFSFSLEAPTSLELSVLLDSPTARLGADLRRLQDGREVVLWTRTPDRGGLDASPLALTAGEYRLRLEREDGSDSASPYQLTLATAPAPRPNQEAEPNDTPASAQALTEDLRVSGSGGADDEDRYRFTIPGDKADHLWRVFTVDADRIQLRNDEGMVADVTASGRRSMADALALSPGEYQVTVRADGDYLLRVMDLGPRPSDYEGEPNDSLADGQRLTFGQGVRGGFHREGDTDYYLFRLETASAVQLETRPAADGATDLKLYLDGRQYGGRLVFEPGQAPYRFQSTLPAGDWAVVLRSLAPSVSESYELGVERLPALAGNEPDDAPLDAAKLPRDGDIAGTVGALDVADQVFVSLPRGEGQAAMLCATEPGTRIGRWRLYRWSDDSKVADLVGGIALFDYAPALGGAVRLGLEGTNQEVAYTCALRFPPGAPPPAGEPAVLAEDGSSTLAPSQTRRATLTAEGPEPVFRLNMTAGAIGFAACRLANGSALAPESRVWELAGVTTPTRDSLGEFKPFVAGDEPILKLRRTYAQRLEGATLPLDVDCTIYGTDDLPRPEDMGPAAEFVLVPADDAAADGDTGLPAGPPPPGLEALIARETPQRQPEGDLPVTLQIEPLPELAGFSDAGQRFTATVQISSESDRPLTLEVRFSVPGEGWRVTPPAQPLTLAPGASHAVSAEITAPPWIAPAQRPELLVRTTAGDAFAAAMADVPVGATSLPVNPMTYWHAPDALRGGLNILHHGLGARITEWGGEATTERQQEQEKALHDGLAPHIGSVNLPPDVAFRLPVTAELVGVMVQLRSTAGSGRWPTEVEVHVPDGDAGWRRVAAGTLESVHAPQYLVFDRPVSTDRLRFTFPRCPTVCDQVYVQELQAIATPGTHPPGLPSINAADPALGGHVVWASTRFGGAWNSEFLVGDPARSNGGWPSPNRTSSVTATVAFHQNRAARVQSVTWIGDPDDDRRIPEGRLDASLAGPGGPWTTLGVLPAPQSEALRSTLELARPAWVRYLRFVFDLPEKEHHYGPDAIEVTEVPGTSVLGLWEDDQPEAAYEARVDWSPPAPVPPTGGADRATAVELPVGEPIRSSVVIERNEDWWRLVVPEGPVRGLRLAFERQRPEVVTELFDTQGAPVALENTGGQGQREAILTPGEYFLRIYEPPRSVVITWDTSGSVAHYVPRTLAAVRTWGRSLQPGRDALHLLPFGGQDFLLPDWAETPEALEPALGALTEENSSDAESALLIAAKALAERRGARGIVVMTDAETSSNDKLWPAMLDAMPRVVSLSVDSDSRANAAVMMDWANVNGGRFQRVIGPLGLADGMDMANALFRAPKAYGLTASLEELVEPEGEADLTVLPGAGGAATGAVELILDASGSMLQRMEGRRRIDIAHDALAGLVRDTLPEGMPFAFRAFGLEEDACHTELKLPLAPLDREAAARAIEAVPAINLAKTAIADSLYAAGEDLAAATPPRVVVLVTDGEETCEGDPEAAIAALREAGLDARVNIVGFAIDDAALTETFASWADSGGGGYFEAGGADALEGAIADALKPRFDIVRTYLDGRTEVVGSVALGDTITVPAGRVTVSPGSGASGAPVTLQLAPDQSASLFFTPGGGLEQAADPGQPTGDQAR